MVGLLANKTSIHMVGAPKNICTQMSSFSARLPKKYNFFPRECNFSHLIVTQKYILLRFSIVYKIGISCTMCSTKVVPTSLFLLSNSRSTLYQSFSLQATKKELLNMRKY